MARSLSFLTQLQARETKGYKFDLGKQLLKSQAMQAKNDYLSLFLFSEDGVVLKKLDSIFDRLLNYGVADDPDLEMLIKQSLIPKFEAVSSERYRFSALLGVSYSLIKNILDKHVSFLEELVNESRGSYIISKLVEYYSAICSFRLNRDIDGSKVLACESNNN